MCFWACIPTVWFEDFVDELAFGLLVWLVPKLVCVLLGAGCRASTEFAGALFGSVVVSCKGI